MIEAKLKELIEDMSVEEKVGQLVMLEGSYFEKDALVTGNINENNCDTESLKAFAGSTIGISGAETVRSIQKKQMEDQPHHIPMLFMLDVIHGYRTVFTCPLGQGASFDPEMSRKCAEIAAREAAASGIHIVFSPMADLVRDSRWGRVMESTGEDVYLNGRMASAMVKGYQGDNAGDPLRVGACVKHFAGYGAPVAGREYYNVELSEHTLREYYLPAYQKAVESGCEMVMSAFNTWNGIPCSGNRWLMKDVLRDEMGFDGVVISDWGAVAEMTMHGFCRDNREAAGAALKAGVDIDMCGNAYAEHLAELVAKGDIDSSLLDEAVMRVLRLKNKLGLFENPYKDADIRLEREIILSKEHRELAREMVRKSIVLLKNDKYDDENVLPLKKGKLAFIGPYVDNADMDSSWAVNGDVLDQISIKKAALEFWDKGDLLFADGCTMLDNHTVGARYYYEDEAFCSKNDSLLKQAVEAAKCADTLVLCLGEHRAQSGEASSRARIKLPKVQLNLLRELARSGKTIITLIFSGRPLELEEILKYSHAVMMVWLPGTEGGHGIMDVLTGKHNPSAKLPISIPYNEGQLPISYDQYSTGRPRTGIHTGEYTSGYIDVPNEPLLPFGYGLSYTDFNISKVSLSSDHMLEDGTITATVRISNQGDVEGTETLQLYLQDVAASRVRPILQLKGFKKISLKAGEEKLVSFCISKEQLSFIRADGSYGCEEGIFRLWIDNSSKVKEPVTFELIKKG
ncbi:glycoside hydrolase family 3 N-terminal domain-containing protein [Butyrivibrio sp. MC2013]|uniref:glycoside hydrolase family 3 N-terminal domain-containing protein n=1 Tax=Butyrivibrio sp. MC2013 TaxID=1280686 RepID=UPI00041D5F52|nr:glycoside hydrolase family 3 N-terminal domain-containing protein [Butyrivibrio sp. MC2013]